MRRRLKHFLVLSLLLTFGFSTIVENAGAAFNPNLLIDDSVFNTQTMSAAQIDSFLNSFSGSCISPNSGFDARVPAGYSPSGGFSYGGFATAGQIIFTAAATYGLNPQVLLVTLQKEQSLVSASSNYCNNGDEHKYASAAGYGCPDGGTYYSWSGVSLYRRYGIEHTNTGQTCVNSASKAGFSQQVIRAAWLLKFGQQRSLGNTGWAVVGGPWDNSDDPASSYGGPMTQGTLKRCQSCAAAYYDGYTSIDGTSPFMGSGATAALYWYTPHYHGNQNFVALFESWFGSTVGDLARSPDNGTVYLISGDNKYPIADQSVLADFSNLGPIRYISNDALAQRATGPTLGHMAGRGDGTLFFVNAGMKLAFTSCASVADYGYSCSSVPYLTDAQLSRLASGPNLTSRYNTTSGKQFYITGGQKREIFDATAATQSGLTDPANTLLEVGLSYLPYGSPVMRERVVAVDRQTHEQFYYEANKYLGLTGELAVSSSFANWPHSSMDHASVPSNLKDNSFKGMVKNNANSQFYLILPTGKALINTPSAWPSGNFMAFSDAFIAGIPSDSSGSINSSLVKSSSNGTVYLVTAGVKRPIASWNDLIGLHITPMAINTIPEVSINAVPAASLAYAPGSLVKTANAATVYVVKDVNTLFPISSFLFPSELGLSTGIRTIINSDISSYAIAGLLRSKLTCNSKYYVGTNGLVYEVPPAMMTAYGFNAGDFIDGTGLCSNLPIVSQTIPGFIRTQDGSIYQIENGTKRGFTNYQAYINHGGTSSNTIQVSQYFADSIANGTSITN
jgi:hypothetical protein